MSSDSTGFEQDVRELLQLQGWHVRSETIMGHKKVDAYAERLDSFGTIQRIAVECKNWAAPLSQNDVTHIYVNYQPLLEFNLVDYIVIVTANGLSPSATAYIDKTRNLRHLTHAHLMNSLIDFRNHLQGLISSYVDDAVAKCYVPQYYEEGEGTLEQYLLDWIVSDDERPIAILGGYGYGKTTLAKRLAYLLATRCQADSSSRVPVVIPLAAIATDQTLDGLLGRLFTSVTLCHNYNFQLFTSLNSRGRFVFLLDGFDEMKKTMSWDSLLFNLTQLNQLVTPQSKVMLLGRPSAFLSSEEQDEALHGKIVRMGTERSVPGWPDYQEVHLRPFTREQVRQFIKRYLDANPDVSHKYTRRGRKIISYLDDVANSQGRHLLDLASRPVQLHMLMEILPEYTGHIDQLTVAALYEEFIDLLLRREAAKPARSMFSKKQRLRFASRLAYWMWEDGKRSEVDIVKLPDSLFRECLDNLPSDVQPLDAKRDLLSGGFLDRKPPNVFYFPHRSFQEYLVADELHNMVVRHDPKLNECSYLTPEATSFFIELVGKDGISKLRKRWSQPAEPSEVLRDLINTGCARYGLDLLVDIRESVSAEDRRRALRQDLAKRDSILMKLSAVGVVSGLNQAVPSAFQGKTKSTIGRRRKAGATKKRHYRS